MVTEIKSSKNKNIQKKNETFEYDEDESLKDLCFSVLGYVPIKQMIFLFFIFLILNTYEFQQKFLSNYTTGINNQLSSKGYIILSLIFVLLFLILNILIKSHIL